MKYLLDTNIISEIRKTRGNSNVKNFVNSLSEEDIYISVISVGEIACGIEKLPPGQKKTELLVWLSQKLPGFFGNRIIPLDTEIMTEWGILQGRIKQTLPIFDSLIAATALSRGFTIVTRNSRDFEKIPGLKLLNHWL